MTKLLTIIAALSITTAQAQECAQQPKPLGQLIYLTGREGDAMERVMHALEQIADGEGLGTNWVWAEPIKEAQLLHKLLQTRRELWVRALREEPGAYESLLKHRESALGDVYTAMGDY